MACSDVFRFFYRNRFSASFSYQFFWRSATSWLLAGRPERILLFDQSSCPCFLRNRLRLAAAHHFNSILDVLIRPFRARVTKPNERLIKQYITHPKSRRFLINIFLRPY